MEKEINHLKRKLDGVESEEEEELATDRSINSFRGLGIGGAVRTVNYRVTRVNDLGVPELKQQLNELQKKVGMVGI